MSVITNGWKDPEHLISMSRDDISISRTSEMFPVPMQHVHDSSEILLIEEGRATYTIDGVPYHVSSGDILVIGPLRFHKRTVEESPFTRYGVTVHPRWYSRLLMDPSLERVFQTPSPEDHERSCRKIDPERFNRIISLIERLDEEMKEREVHSALTMRAMTEELAVLLFRAFHYDGIGERPNDFRIQEARNIMDTGYTDPGLSLENIAERVKMHPAALSREFHRETGFTLTGYLNRVRIMKATHLLEDTDLTVSAVSDSVGYGAENTFTRQFRKAMETSPAEYRKRRQVKK